MPAKKSGYPRSIDGKQTRLYRIWSNINQRCNNPKNTRYHDYGGRGIEMCDRWRRSFDAFAADVGEPPSIKHSLDRRDNDGNYEPGNCRWADAITQATNSRRAVLVTINKVTRSIAGWCRHTGIGRCTFHQRRKAGWDLVRSLTEPANIKEGRTITHGGKTLTLKQWAEETGIEYKTLVARDRRGEKPPEIFRKSQWRTPVTFGNRTMTMAEWARLLGRDQTSLKERLEKGQPLVRENELHLL